LPEVQVPELGLVEDGEQANPRYGVNAARDFRRSPRKDTYMKSWAFSVATIALLSGLYLILRHKKWVSGTWIVCLALAVFAGASLNIGTLFSVGDAFKYSQVTQQLSALSNTVQALRISVVQSVVLTQQINQTVNMVTEVRKEVADMRELIRNLYDRARTETIQASDTNRLTFLDKSDGAHMVAIQLSDCPVPKSVTVVAQTSSKQFPVLATSDLSLGNFLLINWDKSSQGFEACSYTVSYISDLGRTNRYTSITTNGNQLLLDGCPMMIKP
jgi:hypothetical protein